MQNKCESNTKVISSGILFIDVVAKYYTVYNGELSGILGMLRSWQLVGLEQNTVFCGIKEENIIFLKWLFINYLKSCSVSDITQHAWLTHPLMCEIEIFPTDAPYIAIIINGAS